MSIKMSHPIGMGVEGSNCKPPKHSSINKKKSWTILAYLNGHNNLNSTVDNMINTFEKIGSTDDVNLVIEAAHDIDGSTKRYNFGESLDHIENLGQKDMADSGNLVNFLQWGIKQYPAKHYFLMLKGHGHGHRGLMDDTTFESRMSLEE